MKKLLSIILCLAMVVGFFTFGVSAETKTATLVTDASSLKADDQVVIVSKNGSNYYALSTSQKSSNRGATAVTCSGNEVTLSADTQVLTLKTGESTGTFGFYTGAGYLYAGSSDKNQLKTQTTNNANGSFKIEIASNGVATVKAQGTNTRNWLRFNLNTGNGDPLFACYKSGQLDIYIYRLGDSGNSGNQGGTQTPVTTDYIIIADGKAMTKYTGTNTYGYHPGVAVTVSGTTVTGSKGSGPSAIFKIAEVDGGVTIQDADGRYLSASEGFKTITIGSTAAVWTMTNNKLTTTVGSVTRTLAIDPTYGSFGAYKESELTNMVSELTFVKNPTWVDKSEEWDIAKILADGVTGSSYKTTGVITYIKNNNKEIYIQDGDKALCLYFNAAQTGLNLGDVITAEGSYKIFNGLPELAGVQSYTEASGKTANVNTSLPLTTDDICTAVKLTNLTVVIKVEGDKTNTYLSDGTNEYLWYNPVLPDGVTLADGDTIAEFKGAVGCYNALQLVNTKADDITIVACDCDDSELTWKTEGNEHWQECACGNRPITKCSTTLVTVNAEDDGHYDKCPDCGFETSKVQHTMNDKKDATHHWTACACGEATEKVEHDLEYKSDDTHHWQECKGCDHSTEATKEAHNFGTTYQKDAENHYLECVCGAQSDKGAHSDGDDEDKLCDKCGLDMSCTHANGYKWTHDATNHWEECKDCGLVKAGSKAAHTLDGKKDADKHWSECTNTNCGYATEKVAHTMDAKKDATHHWTECTCGQATTKVEHTMAKKTDETHHWTECTCGQATEKVEHTLVGGKCDCGYSNLDSIKDALAGEKNDVFTVTGVVNLIDGKNVYIQDATGGICIYLSAAPEGLKLGDTITATGKRDTYNGLPELVQATYEKVAEGALELKPAEKTLETLTAADVGTYVTLKDLTVVEVYDKNGEFSAPNITVQDAKGNKIQIYKAQVEKVGEGWSIKVGDKLTITASVGIYKETLQLRNTVAGEIVVNTANSATGDIFGVFVAMMAVSGMGLTVVLKKKH